MTNLSLSTSIQDRMTLIPIPSTQKSEAGQDILQGLAHTPEKYLPSYYFYDEAGSELFELITDLPEYYQTRTEYGLLRQAAASLFAQVGPVELVELGSGSSTKTQALLDVWHENSETVTYRPIDISPTMLAGTASRLVEKYPRLSVTAYAGDYLQALSHLPPEQNRMFLFLGGTLGNFSEAYQTTFFNALKENMLPGNTFLLGYDRAPNASKPVEKIQQAYDDSQGITAEFNLNMLTHLNTLYQADFKVNDWRHEAVFSPIKSRIEMRLRMISDSPQSVTFKALNQTVIVRPEETVLTEISRKFEPQDLAVWFKTIGFDCLEQFSDVNQYYGIILLQYNG